MKVLHINNVASVGESLASAQRAILGDEVQLISIIPRQNKFTRWEKFTTFLERILLVIRARRLIVTFKPDVLHVHYSTSAVWMLGVKAKLIVHAHGSDLRLAKTDIIRGAINRIGLSQANRLLYSTPDLKEHASRYGVEIDYLPNPVDSSLYKCCEVGGWKRGRVMDHSDSTPMWPIRQ